MNLIYVKSVYSFLNSLITIDDLIAFAKKHDFHAVCLCDDNMYGVMEFIDKCQKNSLNPIVGLDLDGFLLYAKNYHGYENLMRLSTIKSERNLEIDDLSKYCEDLVAFISYRNEQKNDLMKIFNDYYIYTDDFNQKDCLYLHKTLLRPE